MRTIRLLNVQSLELKEFVDDQTPPYVIASHRWVDDEATFKDVQEKQNTHKNGYKKIQGFANYVKDHISHIEWLWIDTCCINKDSAAELSYSLNSMFKWYRNAEICLAYLADVGSESDFTKSVWFERGWTLQELLAPRVVIFVSREWHLLGNKSSTLHSCSSTSLGSDFTKRIADRTAIPEDVLADWASSVNTSVEDKLKWITGRQTAVPEDMYYALFGIVGVTPGANYGEGIDGAKQRLHAAIRQRDGTEHEKTKQFRCIVDWLAAPDPWTNHNAARKRHQSDTGQWLIDSKIYSAWKSKSGLTTSSRCLWVHGKAGCGKTILCSTAIKNLQSFCSDQSDNGHAVFYFSFTDWRKQTYGDLLISLLTQLGGRGRSLSMLNEAYKKSDKSHDTLKSILKVCIGEYVQVFINLDGIDECPETDNLRENVLAGVEDLVTQVPNVKILVTSRDEPDIRSSLERLSTTTIEIAARTVDPDIRMYVSEQLSRRQKLSRLSTATKKLVEDALTDKADGMFRWVYCQLHELEQSKSTRPTSIEAALRALPKTLDETYERMLDRIKLEDPAYVLTILRWLAYAERPLSLLELTEASVIAPADDPTADGVVATDDKGHWRDTLDLLAGFLVVDYAHLGDKAYERGWFVDKDLQQDSSAAYRGRTIDGHSRVRLAHFSIKEYLESSRIGTSSAGDFHLIPAREHNFLAQSCLVYLMHYSDSAQKTSSRRDLDTFDLLLYAAKSWPYHASHQECQSTVRETRFLSSEKNKYDWLYVYAREIRLPSVNPFEFRPKDIGPSLYYASFLGLERIVEALIAANADVNGCDGIFGNALQAASLGGHEKTVQILLAAGADVNLEGGQYCFALQAACSSGNLTIVQSLLNAKADVNAKGGGHGTALQVACKEGREKVVQVLLDAGADVNSEGEGVYYGFALQAACAWNHLQIVQSLLEVKADVNAQGGQHGTALQAACYHGHQEMVQVLLNAGADVNIQGGRYGSALGVACASGYENIVQMLIEAGVRVNTSPGVETPLQKAVEQGHESVVVILLEAGADIDAEGGNGVTALESACREDQADVVQLLLNRGANLRPHRDGVFHNRALDLAIERSHPKVVKVLLDAGIDVNCEGAQEYNEALRFALEDRWNEGSRERVPEVIQLLFNAGAKVKSEGGELDDEWKDHDLEQFRLELAEQKRLTLEEKPCSESTDRERRWLEEHLRS